MVLHKKADSQELHQQTPLPSSSGWLQPTPWRKIEGREKSEIRVFVPLVSLCSVTLGQWCPSSNSLSSSHDSLLCMTLSFWVPVIAPSPPLLDLGLVTAVFLLAQGAALTLWLPQNSVNSLFIKFSWNDPNLSKPSISCWEPDGYTILHYWSFTS